MRRLLSLQPVAIGSVDGLVNDDGFPGKLASCFTPAVRILLCVKYHASGTVGFRNDQ